jgi:hypothetical protein
MSALPTLHIEMDRKQKRKKKLKLTQMAKSQRKAKTESFEK